MDYQIKYSAIDGSRKARVYKTFPGAQKFAQEMVGKHPDIGHYYAISSDGIGKITANVSLLALFPEPPF